MNFSIILRAVWPILLVLFLGISVAQLSERLKNKTCSFYPKHYPNQPDHSPSQQTSDPMMRANALLGVACIVLAAFWGFDALLSWWLFAPSS